ncbi:DUF3006 domain-containing protein [Paenibacillus puldeungensis]|uniref:DUF3006 domain-containing protein n=1 Tax=Paenibacillus puldeungensis TaxID=696536 RepID=A0ABW3RUI4_9BACL
MAHIVEGFEGDFCIIESDGKTRDIPRKLVDPTVKAGDVVEWNGNKWMTNRNKTDDRSREIKELMDEVWEE